MGGRASGQLSMLCHTVTTWPDLYVCSAYVSLLHDGLTGILSHTRIRQIDVYFSPRRSHLLNAMSSKEIENVPSGFSRAIAVAKGEALFIMMMHRDRLKRWYEVVARSLFLLLPACSSWPCLGPA